MHLENEVIEILQYGNRWFKPKVIKMFVYDRTEVIKDYSQSHCFLKPIVKRLVRREKEILKQLHHFEAIPVYYGEYGSYGFRMEYIHGKHPEKQKPLNNPCLYQQALNYLKQFHNQGFTYNDFRAKNILITPDQKVKFIDLGSALHAPCKQSIFSKITCPFFNKLRLADSRNLLKLKPVFTGQSLTYEEKKQVVEQEPFRHINYFWKTVIRRKPRDDSEFRN